MKRIIDHPQVSDMGSGMGHFEFQNKTTLKEALTWIMKNEKTWGVITIYINDDDIIRCFDYDCYSSTPIFYHHLNSWQYNLTVQAIKFNYCFMGEDIDIYVK